LWGRFHGANSPFEGEYSVYMQVQKFLEILENAAY